MNDSTTRSLVELFGQIKILAREYYDMTGKPLGVTGEIGEFEAARLLGVQLCGPRNPGYDALRRSDTGQDRLSIKTVRFSPSSEAGWRIGTINFESPWDSVLMVLLNLDFEPREIWEADRAELTTLLSSRPRKDPRVREFKTIGKLVWPIAMTVVETATGNGG